ncbi:MAG: MerR family transcriptional regulator, partial [Burkholderiales bacterium]|nr:MerR family transcriptional regulator [Burkholderiales bacterium]
MEEIYNDAMSLYPVDVVNRRLLVPLLRALGERWANQEAGVAEEHFFAAYMRNKLGARFHHRTRHSAGPLLVTACIEGERHEIGLL